MRLAANSEEALSMSTESIAEETRPKNGWISSVQAAYFNGQLVAVKNIQKPFVTLTKSIILEINQVN